MTRLAAYSYYIALLLAAASSPAATPARYDLAASIASVPATGGASFGSRFFFTSSNQTAYRLIPSGQTEGNPAAKWQFWSSTAGARDILPVTGDLSLDVFALANGQVVGKSVGATTETALYWTLAAGSVKPDGFDSGYNGLSAINAAGAAAGYTDNGTPEVVAWDAAHPAAGVTTISPPPGCTSPQIVGVSGSGEVLIYVRDAGSVPRAAIWNGTTSTLIGPAPSETFYPANCAINSQGDVAMLVFTAGGSGKLHYIPAADRSSWLTFSFDGPVGSSGVYNLRISDAGLASFDTSINGVNTVAIVSAVQQQQFTFTGYRSYLNNAGTLVFGDQGNLLYWDAAAWSGQPAIVPVSATVNSGGLSMEGFNDDGRVLATIIAQSTRSLVVLSPFLPQPASVRLTSARKILRLRVGRHVRQALVKIHITGDTLDGRVRFFSRGKFPPGLAFRNSEAMIIGTPTTPRKFTLRIGAAYTSGGVKKQTPLVKVKAVIRPAF